MTDPAFPKFEFREPFEGLVAFEVQSKGWYNGLTVELEDGRRFPLYFYDPVRLAQDLESYAASGEPFVAEPFMIVVPEVTAASMRTAVLQLHQKDWFNGQHAI